MISNMAMHAQLSFFLLLQFMLYFSSLEGSDTRPNIIFILTDDQDTEIGGMVSVTTLHASIFHFILGYPVAH